MKTSLLSSKKCLTAKAVAILIALSGSAFAANSRIAPSQTALVQDINANKDADFESVLEHWTTQYGTLAAQPLLSIAKDRRNSDRQRYIAIMGAAKLGGPAVAEKLVPLLKDKIWLIRSATLKALAALKDPATANAVLPLLKDPALVVRVEAIETVKILKPEGSAQALVSVLQSQENYRFGKAQWAPQRALSALVVLHDFSVVPYLRPLLDHQKDPELQRQTIFALQTLTGIDKDSKLALSTQVETWKKILSGDRTPVVTSSAHSEPSPFTNK
jgi:HEAT repeat protein